MTPANLIKTKVRVGSIIKNGKEIVCSVATETSSWTRPEEIAQKQGPAFLKALERMAPGSIGSDTKEIFER